MMELPTRDCGRVCVCAWEVDGEQMKRRSEEYMAPELQSIRGTRTRTRMTTDPAGRFTTTSLPRLRCVGGLHCQSRQSGTGLQIALLDSAGRLSRKYVSSV